MSENKKEIIFRLMLLLKSIRAGANIKKLDLSEDEETVTIEYYIGTECKVNVACDSGYAMINDVMKALQ